MRHFALWLLAPALLAQQGSLPSGVLAEIRKNPGPTFLIQEEKGHALASGFARLKSHEALADFDLTLLSPEWATWNKDLAAWLKAQLGTGGWVLLDREARVLAQGKVWPEPEALAATLVQAGVRSPAAELETFLKAHPDHLEARVERISILFRRAESRTRALIGVQPKPRDPDAPDGTGSSWTGGEIPPPPAPVPLPPAQDRQIWGPLAQELERHFAHANWGEAIPDISTWNMYPVAVHSPLMGTLARRHLATVQNLLQKDPANYSLWYLWVSLKTISGLKADRAFIQSILPDAVQVEGHPMLPPPSERTIMAVVADARRTGDWTDAKALLLAHWEARVPKGSKPRPARPGEEARWVKVNVADTEAEWERRFAPTLEALVRTRDEARALEVVDYVKALPYLSAIPERLRSLALDLGRPDLAAKWTA
jgi:hypothetical protein